MRSKPDPDAKLLCWQEDVQWLVACRLFDIVAQGPTIKEAYERFCRVFTVEVLLRVNPDRTIAPLPIPPPEVVERWEWQGRRSVRLSS